MTNLSDTEDFLSHYGVKGMKWGVRKDDHPGASRKTNKEARKDAQEYARAQMFYGDGAGNRRKLIKASVNSKSSKDSSYKEAFDHHLSRQDMGKHATKARSERRRTDTKQSVTKTTKGVHRKMTGQMGNVTLASAVIASGIVYAKKSGADQIIMNSAKQKYTQVRNQTRANSDVTDWMKKNGFMS